MISSSIRSLPDRIDQLIASLELSDQDAIELGSLLYGSACEGYTIGVATGP